VIQAKKKGDSNEKTFRRKLLPIATAGREKGDWPAPRRKRRTSSSRRGKYRPPVDGGKRNARDVEKKKKGACRVAIEKGPRKAADSKSESGQERGGKGDKIFTISTLVPEKKKKASAPKNCARAEKRG